MLCFAQMMLPYGKRIKGSLRDKISRDREIGGPRSGGRSPRNFGICTDFILLALSFSHLR